MSDDYGIDKFGMPLDTPSVQGEDERALAALESRIDLWRGKYLPRLDGPNDREELLYIIAMDAIAALRSRLAESDEMKGMQSCGPDGPEGHDAIPRNSEPAQAAPSEEMLELGEPDKINPADNILALRAEVDRLRAALASEHERADVCEAVMHETAKNAAVIAQQLASEREARSRLEDINRQLAEYSIEDQERADSAERALASERGKGEEHIPRYGWDQSEKSIVEILESAAKAATLKNASFSRINPDPEKDKLPKDEDAVTDFVRARVALYHDTWIISPIYEAIRRIKASPAPDVTALREAARNLIAEWDIDPRTRPYKIDEVTTWLRDYLADRVDALRAALLRSEPRGEEGRR